MSHEVFCNVNDEVRVKLTDAGRRVLERYDREVDDVAERLGETVPLVVRTEERGYVKFQLWELMNIFGRHLRMGATQVFADNEIGISLSVFNAQRSAEIVQA